MKTLYQKAIHKLLVFLVVRAHRRSPDFVLKGYMDRWWLIPRNRVFNVYLHRFWGSDLGRDPHDHMYMNLSIVLSGKYDEWQFRRHEPLGLRIRRPGAIVLRLPSTPHQIRIQDAPVWTIFITGPRVRQWGFWTKDGWVAHDEYAKLESPLPAQGNQVIP